MGKFIIFISALFIYNLSNAQLVNVSGGLAYGSEINLGFFVTPAFHVGNNQLIITDIIFYLPKKETGNYVQSRFNRWELNANYAYRYDIAEKISFFPLAGLNIMHIEEITRLNTTKDPRFESTDKEFEIGINIGGGIYYNISHQFSAFSKIKYTFHDFNQWVIKTGISYFLQKNTEKN